MKRLAILGTCAAMLAAGGCVRPMRSISMEFNTPEGYWRLDDIRSARLDLKDWQVRILEAKIASATTVPYLERLVVEVANTSSVRLPLVLPANAVELTGMTDPLLLGPGEKLVLEAGQSRVFLYDPGIRADVLAYPFHLRITAQRPGQGPPQVVRILLY